MNTRAFTTADIAKLCYHSSETVKRWIEQGNVKGYRIGTSGHWRVLPQDLALFLRKNNIPFPGPQEIGIDLKALTETASLPTFCWEFRWSQEHDHVRPGAECQQCLVYKAKCIDCYALREDVGHKRIYCDCSCADCEYFHLRH